LIFLERLFLLRMVFPRFHVACVWWFPLVLWSFVVWIVASKWRRWQTKYCLKERFFVWTWGWTARIGREPSSLCCPLPSPKCLLNLSTPEVISAFIILTILVSTTTFILESLGQYGSKSQKKLLPVFELQIAGAHWPRPRSMPSFQHRPALCEELLLAGQPITKIACEPAPWQEAWNGSGCIIFWGSADWLRLTHQSAESSHKPEFLNGHIHNYCCCQRPCHHWYFTNWNHYDPL